MLTAERVNRRQAAPFVFREEIRYRITLPDGTLRRDNLVTYEVTLLEGEYYHRRVAINDRPLEGPLAELEERRFREVEAFRRNTPIEERRRRHFAAEEERFRIDSRLVLQHHDLTLSGSETIAGRPCWIVSTLPRKGTPKPRTRSEASLAQRLDYWIDKETAIPLRVQAEFLQDLRGTPKGTRATLQYIQVEGVWLLQRVDILARVKSGRQWIEDTTEQVYSNYRRFAAASVLIFEDDPPKPPEPPAPSKP